MKKTATILVIAVAIQAQAAFGTDVPASDAATQEFITRAGEILLERYAPDIATNMVFVSIAREQQSQSGPFYGSAEAQHGDVIWVRMRRTDDEVTTTNGPSIHSQRTIVRIALRPDGQFISIREQREDHIMSSSEEKTKGVQP